MKKKEKNKPYGYGPLVLLMGACVAVMAGIVLTLVTAEESDRDNINIGSIQLESEISENVGMAVSDVENWETQTSELSESETAESQGAEPQTEEFHTTETQPESAEPEISAPET